MDNFNEATDIDINLFVEHLVPIYDPIRDRITLENPSWPSQAIRDEATKQLNEIENFKIIKVEQDGPMWIIRFPTEQHKLQYLLKHL